MAGRRGANRAQRVIAASSIQKLRTLLLTSIKSAENLTPQILRV